MPEAAIPKRSEPRLFRKDAIFKTSDFLFPEAELICDCSDEIADLDTSARSEESEIVEITWLVSSAVLESHDFFGGDFVEGIRRDRTIFRYVVELCIAAQDRKQFDWKK